MIKHDREIAQGLVEYALIFVGVALAVILALNVTGSSVAEVYCQAVVGLGGSGCGCAFDFESPDSLQDWSGSQPDAFAVENGKACITGNGSRAFSYFNSCATRFGESSFVINVTDVTVDRVVQNNKYTGFDVWFRAQDDGNGYHFTYNSRGHFVRFWKRVDGRWIRLGHANVPPSWADETLNFQIKVEGNQFTAYKDGQMVLQASDSTYSEGQIGLRNKPSSKTCVGEYTVEQLP